MATQKVYVENNLLAYVASHVDGSSKVKLIEVVVNHYSQDAIIQVKKDLRQSITQYIPDFEGLKKDRVNSTKRENYVAETEDIVGAMIEIGRIIERERELFSQVCYCGW